MPDPARALPRSTRSRFAAHRPGRAAASGVPRFPFRPCGGSDGVAQGRLGRCRRRLRRRQGERQSRSRGRLGRQASADRRAGEYSVRSLYARRAGGVAAWSCRRGPSVGRCRGGASCPAGTGSSRGARTASYSYPASRLRLGPPVLVPVRRAPPTLCKQRQGQGRVNSL